MINEFNQEQFEFIEIFLAYHGANLESVDDMFTVASAAWIEFEPDDKSSFYQQAVEFLEGW